MQLRTTPSPRFGQLHPSTGLYNSAVSSLYDLVKVSRLSTLLVTYQECVAAKNLSLRSNCERYLCLKGDPGVQLSAGQLEIGGLVTTCTSARYPSHLCGQPLAVTLHRSPKV